MVHEYIKTRRSPVIFSDKPVEDSKLESLFEAARWAPSSYNQQPWRFIVTVKNNKEFYKRLFDCLSPANKLWAKNVPILILSIAESISGYNHKMNKYAFHDTGMAVCNLLFQATSLGLYVHQMGGYDNNKARKVLNIPDGFDPVAVIAVGYLAQSYDGFPAELIEREKSARVRKPLRDIVFYGTWENKMYE
jgi:nitroreductase